MFRHRDLSRFGGSNEIIASMSSGSRRVLASQSRSGNPLRVGRLFALGTMASASHVGE